MYCRVCPYDHYHGRAALRQFVSHLTRMSSLAGLASAVAAAPGEAKAVAAFITRMPGRQICDILSDELLVSLGASVEPVLRTLAIAQPGQLASWATVRRLQLLSLRHRKLVCSKLASSPDRLPAEVAAIVAETLS